ncbi:MAG: glycosyltransferase family 39 protein [Candidatus Kerfeldbacteria bacterium]|nr:glycosyltransferase family 39 protein [Candidatus Kerfeldbacteria bacterium]
MLTVSKRGLGALVIGGALLVSATLMLTAAVEDSQTADEATYLVSGLSYWRTGDFRLNVEHPPVLKLWLSLPLRLGGVPFVPTESAWAGASQWDIALTTLYGSSVPGHELLVSARLMNVMLTIALVAVAALLAYKTWGGRAAVVAAVLTAFEPNVLANGHLATTDVGYTLGLLASLLTFGWFLERRTTRRLLLAASAFAVALLTRFNALILVGLLPTVYVVARQTAGQGVHLPGREMLRIIGTFAGVSLMTVWAFYGFEVRTLTGVQDQTARQVLSSFGPLGQWIQSVSLPAASYLSGLLWQVGHNAVGQPAYLFGQTSQTGWWYYFPAAMVIKMTLASLLLAAAAIWFTRGRSAEDGGRVFSTRYILISLVVILVAALPSKLNLGVRYVLPAMTLLLVLASGAAAAWTPMRKVLVGALVLWHVVSVVHFAPTFLPYANEAFGGPTQLHRYLIDSNLDWGQDLIRVRRYLEANHITAYRFRSFTTAPARAYGLLEHDVPTDETVANEPFHGVIVVGQSFLYYPGQQLEWLKRLRPTAVIGQATNVYDLR